MQIYPFQFFKIMDLYCFWPILSDTYYEPIEQIFELKTCSDYINKKKYSEHFILQKMKHASYNNLNLSYVFETCIDLHIILLSVNDFKFVLDEIIEEKMR